MLQRGQSRKRDLAPDVPTIRADAARLGEVLDNLLDNAVKYSPQNGKIHLQVELRGDDIGGIAVHIAARVATLAEPGEVLVSHTVVDLVAGSGIDFADRGMHELKGVPRSWQLFAVEA